MKRFYTTVSVIAEADRFTVALDGRPVRTPAKSPLAVPSKRLAQAIADEWEAQSEQVKPLDMPLTRLISTALDRVPAERPRLEDELTGYADSDLLCYRADHPPELVARQEAAWQPLLDWAEGRFDARLEPVQGVMHRSQPPDSLAALRQVVETQDDLHLAALHSATAAAGSLVIGLALLETRVDAQQAFELSQLDESFQIEQWGEDAEAARRRDAIREELALIEQFLTLSAPRS